MVLRKPWVWLTVLAVGVVLAVLLVDRGLRVSGSSRYGCPSIPMAPAITPETYPGSYLWPYGAVRSCRELDGWSHLFGDVDLSFTLLVQTDAGPVLVRLDYSKLDWGRRYVAQATELDPEGADLTAEEIQQIKAAIGYRGGLQPTPWIVHYGDG